MTARKRVRTAVYPHGVAIFVPRRECREVGSIYHFARERGESALAEPAAVFKAVRPCYHLAESDSLAQRFAFFNALAYRAEQNTGKREQFKLFERLPVYSRRYYY